MGIKLCEKNLRGGFEATSESRQTENYRNGIQAANFKININIKESFQLNF